MTGERILYPKGSIVWVRMEVQEERPPDMSGRQRHFLRLGKPGNTHINQVILGHKDIPTDVMADD